MSHPYLQGRTPPLPFELALPNGQTLTLEHWLRVLPDQRYVARAQWQERPVLVKLFVGAKAESHYQRELDGAQCLANQQLNTPELLVAQYQAGWGGWILFEFLEQAHSLGERWHACAAQPLLSPEQRAILQQALHSIASMHRQGVWQSDLHLDNLLEQAGELYIIDGGGMAQDTLGQPLTEARVRENLAVFFAQLPRGLDEHLDTLLADYTQHNPSVTLVLPELRQAIQRVRAWRVKDYLKKTARDCSLFSVQTTARGIQAVQRRYLPRLQALLDHPDAYIAQGHLYKTGGAATVARVEHDGQQWIIKRYNIKDFGHWLKRCWRPSRAWHSWQAAHRLSLLDIPVANTLAVKETRRFGLRSTAWLVSEYCGEEDLIARFAPYVETGQVPEADVLALQALLNGMIRERISHGDLKGHNILWHNDRCLLIDLDAVRQHRCSRSFARAFKRDRARLLRNWPPHSPLYQRLNRELPQE